MRSAGGHGGKHHSTRVRHGAPWVRTTFVQAAWAATRARNSYLQARFHRVKGRRGPKKAVIGVAASMLTAAYFMLRHGVEYRDLGGRYFEDRDTPQMTDRRLPRLRNLDVSVEVKAA